MSAVTFVKLLGWLHGKFRTLSPELRSVLQVPTAGQTE